MKLSHEINILDCTFRDGGYYNLWNFDKNLVKDYLDKIAKSKVNFIEIGFLFLKEREKNYGDFAFTDKNFLSRLKTKNKNIAIMFNAADLLEKKFDKKFKKVLPVKNLTNLKLIRIAAHYNEIFKLKNKVEHLRKKDFEVAINLMQITELSKGQIEKALKFISDHNLADIFYFADSLGSLNPKKTSMICKIICENWKKPFGIHAHDNCGLALKNTISALKNGASWADATISGMGRGAGNVATEDLLKKLNSIGVKDYSANPLIQLSKKKFIPMKKKYGWGKSDIYFLAAKYKIHPTYVQEILSKKNLKKEEILRLMKRLYKLKKNLVKFDSNIINNKSIKFDHKKLWNAKNFLNNENLIILGQGNSLRFSKSIIMKHKKKYNCKVFSLNLNQYYNYNEIDYLIVTDKIRALLDFTNYRKFRNIIMPKDNFLNILPKKFLSSLDVKNFGMKINSKKLIYRKNYCQIPSALSLAYAVGLGKIGNAKNIFLAGFDGYTTKNNYQLEMENLINKISKLNIKNLFSITPTKYNIKLFKI